MAQTVTPVSRSFSRIDRNLASNSLMDISWKVFHSLPLLNLWVQSWAFVRVPQRFFGYLRVCSKTLASLWHEGRYRGPFVLCFLSSSWLKWLHYVQQRLLKFAERHVGDSASMGSVVWRDHDRNICFWYKVIDLVEIQHCSLSRPMSSPRPGITKTEPRRVPSYCRFRQCLDRVQIKARHQNPFQGQVFIFN